MSRKPADTEEDRREQRKHPRFQSKQLVRFIRENGEEIRSISKIINVSQGGLQFACREKIEIDAVLRMDIEREGLKPVSLSARVIWIHPSPDANGQYYSGVIFINMDEDARGIVLKAIAGS